MPIIGLAGRIGSGKTLAARHLENHYGFIRVPFAGPLKRMLLALGLREEDVYGSPEHRAAPHPLLGGKSPRWAVQSLGTEWGRGLVDENLWVNAWQRDVNGSTNVVADDLRFENEANAVRSLGGVVVRITRYGRKADDHVSEQGDFDADFEVMNDGDVFRLYEQIDSILAQAINA